MLRILVWSGDCANRKLLMRMGDMIRTGMSMFKGQLYKDAGYVQYSTYGSVEHA